MPMDLAVPTMDMQIDSRGTTSLPGSVFFTWECARVQVSMNVVQLNVCTSDVYYLSRLRNLVDVLQRNGAALLMARLVGARHDALSATERNVSKWQCHVTPNFGAGAPHLQPS